MIRASLLTTSFDPAERLSAFLAALGGEDGAVTSFIGRARACGKHGEPIDSMFLEHHPRLTERSLNEIAGAGPNEPIVWVAVASRHRRAAFEAADYLMDRLKTEAVFWKREDSASGTSWIEPTDADYAERARWE